MWPVGCQMFSLLAERPTHTLTCNPDCSCSLIRNRHRNRHLNRRHNRHLNRPTHEHDPKSETKIPIPNDQLVFSPLDSGPRAGTWRIALEVFTRPSPNRIPCLTLTLILVPCEATGCVCSAPPLHASYTTVSRGQGQSQDQHQDQCWARARVRVRVRVRVRSRDTPNQYSHHHFKGSG